MFCFNNRKLQINLVNQVYVKITHCSNVFNNQVILLFKRFPKSKKEFKSLFFSKEICGLADFLGFQLKELTK